MKRIILTVPAILAAEPVLADPGLHHHPHGITAGWVVAAAVLLAVPVAVLAMKRVRN